MGWTLIKISGDLLVVNLSFIAAFLLRFQGSIPPENWEAYVRVMPWITLLAFLLCFVYGLYSRPRKRWEEIFYSLICAVIILSISSVAISYFFHQFAFPRLVFIISFPLLLIFMSLWRYWEWKWTLKRLGPMKLLIATSSNQAVDLARRLDDPDGKMSTVTGLILEEGTSIEELEGFPVAGSYRNLYQAYKNHQANGIVVSKTIPLESRAQLIIDALGLGAPVFLIPHIYEIMMSRTQLEQINGLPSLRVKHSASLPMPHWKRAMDILLATFLGIIAMPLIAIAALAIKLEYPSEKVLFRQKRVGLGNKSFMLLKLRTMIPDAEKETGPVLAQKGDHRTTTVGRILRRFRIDELPQLWNVLKGEMAFIGPRPERPEFVDRFSQEVPDYNHRHQVMVGLTGLAQVESNYHVSPEEKIIFDLLYSKDITPLKDLHILFHTLKVMLMKDKSS